MMSTPPRILIADDEETFRASTTAILIEEGYRCDEARDAREANQLLANEYDLLIADLRMPGNENLEFLHQVVKQRPDLPVIVATGYPNVGTAVESFRMAIVDYLIKPIDLEELKRAIAVGIRNREILRALKQASLESAQLAGAVTGLERVLGGLASPPHVQAAEWTVATYVGQAMQHIANLSLLVGKTLGAAKSGQASAPTDVCSLMRCPRLDIYERAIEEAIRVMEATRSSFKSKEIGLLRQRLEGVLSECRRGDSFGRPAGLS